MKAFIVVLLAMAIALVASFPAADLSEGSAELERANRVARSSAWDEEDHGTIKEIVVHKTVHVPYPVEKKVPVVIEKKVPVYITKTIPVSIKIKHKKHKH